MMATIRAPEPSWHLRDPVTTSLPSDASASDRALVERLSNGDEHALGELYDRHAGLVLALARAIVGTEAEAEDVAEEVFIQLWTGAERFDPERGAVRSWLAAMARSRALDHVRARERRSSAHARAAARDPEGVAVDLSEPEPTDRPAERAEMRGALDRALAALNDDQRRAIELAYFSGLSQSEIAGRLGEPLGTIKTRIRDGMSRLRDALEGSRGSLA
jgi:RNA polymerase sigma-70 factor (ECF subfamily)